MRRLIATAIALSAMTTAVARDDHEETKLEPVMPEAASSCAMPDALPPIDADSDRDQLVAHQGKIKALQAGLAGYRECLDKIRANDGITDANRLALNLAHDASVEMEEAAAGNFNEAVQAYKRRNQ